MLRRREMPGNQPEQENPPQPSDMEVMDNEIVGKPTDPVSGSAEQKTETKSSEKQEKEAKEDDKKSHKEKLYIILAGQEKATLISEQELRESLGDELEKLIDLVLQEIIHGRLKKKDKKIPNDYDKGFNPDHLKELKEKLKNQISPEAIDRLYELIKAQISDMTISEIRQQSSLSGNLKKGGLRAGAYIAGGIGLSLAMTPMLAAGVLGVGRVADTTITSLVEKAKFKKRRKEEAGCLADKSQESEEKKKSLSALALNLLVMDERKKLLSSGFKANIFNEKINQSLRDKLIKGMEARKPEKINQFRQEYLKIIEANFTDELLKNRLISAGLITAETESDKDELALLRTFYLNEQLAYFDEEVARNKYKIAENTAPAQPDTWKKIRGAGFYAGLGAVARAIPVVREGLLFFGGWKAGGATFELTQTAVQQRQARERAVASQSSTSPEHEQTDPAEFEKNIYEQEKIAHDPLVMFLKEKGFTDDEIKNFRISYKVVDGIYDVEDENFKVSSKKVSNYHDYLRHCEELQRQGILEKVEEYSYGKEAWFNGAIYATDFWNQLDLDDENRKLHPYRDEIYELQNNLRFRNIDDEYVKAVENDEIKKIDDPENSQSKEKSTKKKNIFSRMTEQFIGSKKVQDYVSGGYNVAIEKEKLIGLLEQAKAEGADQEIIKKALGKARALMLTREVLRDKNYKVRLQQEIEQLEEKLALLGAEKLSSSFKVIGEAVGQEKATYQASEKRLATKKTTIKMAGATMFMIGGNTILDFFSRQDLRNMSVKENLERFTGGPHKEGIQDWLIRRSDEEIAVAGEKLAPTVPDLNQSTENHVDVGDNVVHKGDQAKDGGENNPMPRTTSTGEATENGVGSARELEDTFSYGKGQDDRYLDQALHRLAVQYMDDANLKQIAPSLNAEEAAEQLNVTANLREIILNNKTIAGVSRSDLEGVLEVTDNKVEVKDPEALSRIISGLYDYAQTKVTPESGAMDYVGKVSEERWQDLMDDKNVKIDEFEIEDHDADTDIEKAEIGQVQPVEPSAIGEKTIEMHVSKEFPEAELQMVDPESVYAKIGLEHYIRTDDGVEFYYDADTEDVQMADSPFVLEVKDEQIITVRTGIEGATDITPDNLRLDDPQVKTKLFEIQLKANGFADNSSAVRQLAEVVGITKDDFILSMDEKATLDVLEQLGYATPDKIQEILQYQDRLPTSFIQKHPEHFAEVLELVKSTNFSASEADYALTVRHGVFGNILKMDFSAEDANIYNQKIQQDVFEPAQQLNNSFIIRPGQASEFSGSQYLIAKGGDVVSVYDLTGSARFYITANTPVEMIDVTSGKITYDQIEEALRRLAENKAAGMYDLNF